MSLISILYEYTDEAILREVAQGAEENPSVFNVPTISVSEMLENAWHTLIESSEVTAFELALKQPPLKMTFIGSYNQDGSQYIWTEPTEIQRNHSINSYKNKLKDVIDYDENGEPIGSHRPSEAEALATQVNLIFGQDNRILE